MAGERITARGVARSEDALTAREGRVGVESEAGEIGDACYQAERRLISRKRESPPPSSADFGDFPPAESHIHGAMFKPLNIPRREAAISLAPAV